jgi:RNA polymerase sigma-70 factor (ECF subfamily)
MTSSAELHLYARALEREALGAGARKERLSALFAEHFDFVGRVVKNLGVRGADADDLVAQVFSVATARIRDIDHGRERAFLAQTAVRLVANHRRSHARRREQRDASFDDLADSSPTPEDVSNRRRAAKILDDLMATMSLELRTVFVLFEVEEMTMADIATLLSLPPGTVASRLRRAREAFRSGLDRLRGSARAREGEGGSR